MDFESNEEMTNGQSDYEEVENAEIDQSGDTSVEVDTGNSLVEMTVDDMQISQYITQGMIISGSALMLSIGVAWILKMFPWSR